MPATQQRTRSAPKPEPFIIKRRDDGLEVFSPSAPSEIHIVGGSVNEPTCTCAAFQDSLEISPSCPHIVAVLAQARAKGNGHGILEQASPWTPHSAPPLGGNGAGGQGDGPAILTLKRSVSPDGKIDSLSVELATPVPDLDAEAVTSRAAQSLAIQSLIVDGFLHRNGEAAEPTVKQDTANGSVAARLVRVGGMATRFGRRLFMAVQVNGDMLKFFGTAEQIAAALRAAGHANRAQEVVEGMTLDLPCRVITKPSADGRYVNVEEVFPVSPAASSARVRP